MYCLRRVLLYTILEGFCCTVLGGFRCTSSSNTTAASSTLDYVTHSKLLYKNSTLVIVWCQSKTMTHLYASGAVWVFQKLLSLSVHQGAWAECRHLHSLSSLDGTTHMPGQWYLAVLTPLPLLPGGTNTSCTIRRCRFSPQRWRIIDPKEGSNNNNVHLSCAHQRPERSHDTC